jgi:helix-turn-helix protein
VTTIRRSARPADRFTMISNDFHRDARLSLAARGLGGYLLSHVDGWEITVQRLAKDQGVGREQMRRLLRELEDHGYLRRAQARDEHGLMGGMVYQISCSPFEDETPGHDRCPETRTPVNRAPVSGHHKKTSSKNNIPQKTNPSGGSPPGSAEAEEAAMSRQPDQSLALFEIDPPPPQAEEPKLLGANDVVAAFVDSYRSHHSGGDPLKRDIGRVARDAKASLGAAKATAAELIEAAKAMGSGPYSNLGVQLNILRDRRPRARGIVPIAPREAFDIPGQVAHAKFIAEIKADPEVAAWVADDPAEVAKLVAEDPELEAVFARVSAA